VTAPQPRDTADLPGTLLRRAEEECDRFEAAWRAGLRPRIEDHLAGVPEAERPALLRELLLLELDYRRLAGERPGGEEYLARFPEHAAALREQIDLHRAAAGGSPAATQPAGPEAEAPAAGAGARLGLPCVPGYQVLSELGRGGMGVVYKARQVSLDRLVALKVVLAGEFAGVQERSRFAAEALAVARLQHPNVVQVFEVGEHNGHPYLALEFVEGGSLADRLRSGRPPLPAAELAERLARAVQAAHEKGVVHRDLKPANVLLTADGTPKIADFGLAKRLDAPAAATRTGAIVGTPAYMAPEQAEGRKDVGPAADVWALGAILYECLTGRPPFQGPTPTDTILRVLSDEPPPPRRLEAAVPRDLETIALKCLRKEPAKRYASAGELADDLRRFLAGEPIRARRLSLPERLWRRRRRLLAFGLALLVLALLGASTHALLGWRRERRDRAAFDEALSRGVKQLGDGKTKEGIASFTEALRLRRDPYALTYRGTAYGMLGDTDSALADFAEALQLDPGNALPYRRRAWIYLDALHRYEDAVADLNETIRLDPEQPVAWLGRATAHLKLRRWADAAADLEAAAARAPRAPEIYQLRSVLHAAQGRWAEAAADYRRARPNPGEFLFTEAAAALAGDDQAGYRRAIDRLLTLADASGGGLDCILAARACALSGKLPIEEAQLLRLVETWAKSHYMSQQYPLPRRVQALVWLRVGRVEDAVRQLEACLKLAPDYSPAINHLLLSLAHNRLGRREEAGRALERALRAGVPLSHVHETLEYQLLLREARQGWRLP
jgi:tetratricopeptide (TPR) repeat protein